MILAGRRLNDNMSKNVVTRFVKEMIKQGLDVSVARVLVMGLTFKENCPDLRNTKVVDIVSELASYGITVDVVDPWCSSEDASREYGLNLLKDVEEGSYEGIILAVGHDEFKEMGEKAIRRLGKSKHILFDLKYTLEKSAVDIRL